MIRPPPFLHIITRKGGKGMDFEQKERFAFSVLTHINKYFEEKGFKDNIYTLAVKKGWSTSGEYLGELWYFRVGNFQDLFLLFAYNESDEVIFTEGKNPKGFNLLEEAIVNFVERLNPIGNIDYTKLGVSDMMKIISDMQESFWVRWASAVPPLPKYLEAKLVEEGYEVMRG